MSEGTKTPPIINDPVGATSDGKDSISESPAVPPISATPDDKNIETPSSKVDSQSSMADKLVNKDETASPAANTPPITDSTPEADPIKTEAPVVVSADEVASISDDPTHLQEEIENLTGEVQALESKIDRLTGGATESHDEAPLNQPDKQAPITEDKPAEPAVPEIKTEDQKEEPKEEEKPIVPLPVETKAEPPKQEAAKSGSALTDIYARLDNKVKDENKKIESGVKGGDPGDLTEEGSGTAAAIIAEIVTVIGIFVFIFMLITPFLGDLIPESLNDMLRTVGWLSSVGIIGIGLIISLFARGRNSLKVIMMLFVLLAAFMYLGANNNSLLSPLENLISPFLTFYR
jgi:hypothetical protein